MSSSGHNDDDDDMMMMSENFLKVNSTKHLFQFDYYRQI